MIDLTKGYVDISNTCDFPFATFEIANGEAKITAYEEFLANSLLRRAIKRDSSISPTNQTKIFPHIKHIIEWLRTTDFYTSPASTKYHDACNGGVLDHTLSAYNQLHGLRKVPKFKPVVDNQWASAVFAILVHDADRNLFGEFQMNYTGDLPDFDPGENQDKK